MERKYCLLNLSLLLWLFALMTWCLGKHTVARYSGLLAFTAFVIQAFQGWVLPMFKKHKHSEVPAVISTPVPVNETAAASIEKHTNTVIASDVHVEGNIVSSTPVYIHGSLHGNITAPDGLIKVMRNGIVEGNITCRELIIDGNVIGQCMADTVEIYENGTMSGTLAYRHIAVKKGGKISGQIDLLPPEKEKNNVVGLKIDSPIEQGKQQAIEESGQKKSQHPAG